jgi:hypothetical protein
MKLLRNRKGQGMMEYILIAAFVVGLVVYLVTQTRGPVQKNVDDVVKGLNTPGQ